MRLWILMFLISVILFLSCIEITSSSANSVFSLIKKAQKGALWLRCANGLQTCSVSTPAATMVKSYSSNSLWTMITTIFHEKSNYNISEPIIRFSSTTCATSFTSEQFLWFIQLFNETLQHFARFSGLFRSVMWSIFVPFSFLLSFFLSFLIL